MINISSSFKKKLIRRKLDLSYLLSKKENKYININKKSKKIIIALAADYGNLGDVAITYAQTKILKSKFPDYEIIDFPISRTFKDMKELKKICTQDDLITIVGGGNTGDMYDDIEYCRQFVINQFPNNRIISFPQTIDFSQTDTGRKSLQKSINVYSKHKDLTLSAREEISHKKYKEYFLGNKVLFIPDIVLSLNEEEPSYHRTGITVCLRSDGEKSLDKSKEDLLKTVLEENYNVNYYDTHINKNFLSVQERENELRKIWTVFKKSQLVITDRLHGMIFCAITKTPCIALDNSNHKISGVFNAWLQDLDFIKMVGNFDIDILRNEIEELCKLDLKSVSSNNQREKFELFIDEIKQKN